MMNNAARVLEGQAGRLKWIVDKIHHEMNLDHFSPLQHCRDEESRQRYNRMHERVSHLLDSLWKDQYVEDKCIAEVEAASVFEFTLCDEGKWMEEDIGHWDGALARLDEHIKKCSVCKKREKSEKRGDGT